MNLYKLLLVLGLLIGSFSVNAQYYEAEKKENTENTKPKSIKDKLHFGGSLGLQFGSFTSIYIAPIVYYDLSEKIMIGAGFNYIYQSYDWYGKEYKSSIYGPKLAAIFKPFSQLIVSTEFEYNFYDRDFNYYGDPDQPYWHPTWYVGLGYGVPMGKKGGMYISMSYDLLYDAKKSYYSTAWRPTIGMYF